MKKPGNPGIIPEDVVENTWQKVAVMSEEKAEAEMERVSRLQPALLAFVLANTEELSHEAHELAVYMFFVILHAFETHFGGRIKEVDMKTIELIDARVTETMEKLGQVDEEALERAAIAQNEAQPFVLRYVVETLFDPDEEETDLTEEDQGALFLTMKALTDALNSAVTAQG